MVTLTQFPSGLKFAIALASLPLMSLYAAPAPEVLTLVQQILEEFYTDGIDQIVSATLNKDSDIEGEFIDQVGARQVKRYQYLIQDDNVAFKLINPNEVEQFGGLEGFAGKKKNCKKGTPCGGSCISATKTCKKTPSAAGKEKIKAAKAGLGGTGGKPSVPENTDINKPKIVKGTSSDKKIAKDLSVWKKLAAEKVKKDAKFKDNFTIIEDIAAYHEFYPENSRVLVANGKAQAAAQITIKKDTFAVDFLATAPFNADPKDKNYTKGNGSKLMEQLMLEEIVLNKPMSLDSLSGAVKFYQKLGFKPKGKIETYGATSMVLSVKGMQAFIKSRGIFQAELTIEDLEDQAYGAFCSSLSKKTETEKADILAKLKANG